MLGWKHDGCRQHSRHSRIWLHAADVNVSAGQNLPTTPIFEVHGGFACGRRTRRVVYSQGRSKVERLHAFERVLHTLPRERIISRFIVASRFISADNHVDGAHPC